MKNTNEIIDIDEILIEGRELSPISYQYYRNLKNRKIIFNDEVDENIVELVILPLLEMDRDGTGKPIELVVTTCGGDIYAGMALCDVLDRMQTPTTVTILATAFSMGSLIAIAGHDNPNVKTVCYPFTVFLIHGGSTWLTGSASQVKDSFEFQERYNKMMDNYILQHTKISKELYEEKYRHEWFLTAREALQYEIVDEVL